jgi:hypothetical protein
VNCWDCASERFSAAVFRIPRGVAEKRGRMQNTLKGIVTKLMEVALWAAMNKPKNIWGQTLTSPRTI